MFGKGKNQDAEFNRIYLGFEDRKWNFSSEKRNLKLLKNSFDDRKAEIACSGGSSIGDGSMNFDLDGFKDFPVAIQFKNPDELSDSSAGGIYDPSSKTIYMNRDVCCAGMRDDGQYSYCTLMHESQHALQDYLITNIDRYAEDSAEYGYMLSHWKDSKF